MLVTRSQKHAEMIGKLVAIAFGNIELVQEAVRESSVDGSADLKDVVQYIVVNRSLPVDKRHGMG